MSSSSIPSTPLSPEGYLGDSMFQLEATLVLQIAQRNGPSFLLRPNQENTIGRAAEGFQKRMARHRIELQEIPHEGL